MNATLVCAVGDTRVRVKSVGDPIERTRAGVGIPGNWHWNSHWITPAVPGDIEVTCPELAPTFPVKVTAGETSIMYSHSQAFHRCIRLSSVISPCKRVRSCKVVGSPLPITDADCVCTISPWAC